MGLGLTQKVMNKAFRPRPLSHGSATLPFVISTEAYPDFLPRSTRNDRVCGFQ